MKNLTGARLGNYDVNALLPDELDHVLARALAKDPAQRPSSVRELVAQLGQIPQRRSTAIAVPQPPGKAPCASATPVSSPQPTRSSPTVAILEQMGVPRLRPHETACVDWYFESVIHAAHEVAGPAWPDIARASGLEEFADTDPPTGNNRTRPLMQLAVLTSSMESAYGNDAPTKLNEWGRRPTERALAGRKSSAGEQRAIKVVPSKRRLTLLLKAYIASMDEVRGEPANAWRQIDPDRVWTIHYQNPFALGRSRPDKACHFWIGSYEAMLRWAGLANDWLVDEIECGCVTGTADCVFALRSVKT